MQRIQVKEESRFHFLLTVFERWWCYLFFNTKPMKRLKQLMIKVFVIHNNLEKSWPETIKNSSGTSIFKKLHCCASLGFRRSMLALKYLRTVCTNLDNYTIKLTSLLNFDVNANPELLKCLKECLVPFKSV